jgi:hypothetical protein
MLDVHPAHHAANTWREFFTHIATIVLGLLIAVGLEQLVEHIHNLHQVAETREALRREHDLNVKLYDLKTEEFRRMTPVLKADLDVFLYLQKHPGAPAKDWPGRLGWFNFSVAQVDSAWKTAQQDNVLILMPQAEVRRDAELYRRMQQITDATTAFRLALYDLRRFTIADSDPSHLSPAAIAHQIELTNTALLDHFLEGGAQANLSHSFPEFSTPSDDEFNQILGMPINPEDYQAVRLMGRKAAAILATEDSGTAARTEVNPNP